MGGLRQASLRRTGACSALSRSRDSKDGNRSKILTLDAVEFIRRFLLHILPPGFVKIRHFGFLANRNRSQALALCRQHLQAIDSPPPPIAVLTPQQKQAMERRCPMCQRGDPTHSCLPLCAGAGCVPGPTSDQLFLKMIDKGPIRSREDSALQPRQNWCAPTFIRTYSAPLYKYRSMLPSTPSADYTTPSPSSSFKTSRCFHISS